MTVAELIAELQKLDPELPVWFSWRDGYGKNDNMVDFVEIQSPAYTTCGKEYQPKRVELS